MDVMANYRTHIGNRTPKFEGSHIRQNETISADMVINRTAKNLNILDIDY